MYQTILTALDGSECSRAGGEIAVALARALGSELVACHVYSAELHSRRFVDMEPGLPAEYQRGPSRKRLRSLHGSLIEEGFRVLSKGYVDDVTTAASRQGVTARQAVVSGRNYVKLLQLTEELPAGLIVLGASGLGAGDNDPLGSTALRVLRHARCDVLLVRSPLGCGAILAGVDGSEEALAAAERAAAWARALGKDLELAAAYDGQFHTDVFRTMAKSLSAETRQQVGLAAQEGLHETLINDGLAKLYNGFLADARRRAAATGVEATTCLLEGKACRALVERATGGKADLIVVGRFGHHRQEISELGSNAEAVARLCPCGVLVTASAQDRPAGKAAPAPAASAATEGPPEKEIPWDADALRQLERAPAFVRPMARRAVEQAARAAGARRVTAEIFEQVRRQFGMGPAEGRHDDAGPS